MHKIDKFLARLDPERREKVLAVAERIKARDLAGLDVRKLKGSFGEYRVRVGKIRIKFVMTSKKVHIFDIDFRNDATYH